MTVRELINWFNDWTATNHSLLDAKVTISIEKSDGISTADIQCVTAYDDGSIVIEGDC